MTILNSTDIQAKFLSLLSQHYEFYCLDPINPMMSNLGNKYVVSVVFDLDGFPQLGLSDTLETDAIDYYHFNKLLMLPVH
ncbi:hypothetical protein QWI17_07340 [Gilvimarinus sp. SDUM040013]|uniref:Uncharacterized protein n=1 Tax=Gilvimarinus gilvus TaxID=3058038 RepID=A0ABU4S487_9GAMM|nr:hypothetical protein [Gilvimarinus sp. SDUM040013]MDO3385647.1 hypothetical protein [Gilvimarinus sp. SDUM040013]MDX6851391.1 hypothetical protein [Gilvimarinus sp. SDUM040013]